MGPEAHAPNAEAVRAIVAWLTGGGASRAEAVLDRLGADLLLAGVRVARIAMFVRTLHPELFGTRYTWTPGEHACGVNFPPSVTETHEFRHSPTARVIAANRELRWRLTSGDGPLELPALEEMRAKGMTDYVGHPLRFLGGELHVVVFSTDAPGGFSDGELAALRAVIAPLARVAEVLVLRRVAANLLDVYVGHDAGERILAGRVHRGDTERIHCVIWFSDLRGFTTLSAERDPESTIQLLNRLFECQVDAVERHGGEVLKFIGDGMLAIFNVDGTEGAAAVVRGAVRAAREAFAALDAWNVERAGLGEAEVDFGLALHLGEVAYGNIGSARRLDFTCIGAAVNLASRVEGLTGKLGKRLLLTEAAAKATDLAVRSLGAHALKGVNVRQEVFELLGEVR